MILYISAYDLRPRVKVSMRGNSEDVLYLQFPMLMMVGDGRLRVPHGMLIIERATLDVSIARYKNKLALLNGVRSTTGIRHVMDELWELPGPPQEAIDALADYDVTVVDDPAGGGMPEDLAWAHYRLTHHMMHMAGLITVGSPLHMTRALMRRIDRALSERGVMVKGHDDWYFHIGSETVACGNLVDASMVTQLQRVVEKLTSAVHVENHHEVRYP